MTTKPVVFSTASPEFVASPINPAWIIEGQPVARNAILSRSADGTACTIAWDCTEGRFDWYYDFDETVHIQEGTVIIDDGHGPARRLGPGDVAFFPAGSHAIWHVEKYIRKVAFCRKILPAPLGALINALRAVKHRLSPPKEAASLMGTN
jgi:uncharacterized cupin superfamily protein